MKARIATAFKMITSLSFLFYALNLLLKGRYGGALLVVLIGLLVYSFRYDEEGGK